MIPHAAPERTQFDQNRLDLFWRFVHERHLVWQRRVVDQLPPPWTDDPILRCQRFTNVYRELDPGTIYAINAILEAEACKPDKMFNIMIYRLIGRARTHEALGFQRLAEFDPNQMEKTLRHLRQIGQPPFTAAYMVSAYSSMGSSDKIENVVRLFSALCCEFPRLYERTLACQTLADAHSAVSSAYGFGRFLSYQVLVDLLYKLRIYEGQSLLPFSHDDWACAGPGARRGIQMLLKGASSPADLTVMRWLRDNQSEEFSRLGISFPFLRDAAGEPIPLSLSNIQNCLCEFHKYVKIGDGTGKGRRKFDWRDASSVPTQLGLGENR